MNHEPPDPAQAQARARAIALRYEAGSGAPRVAAKGRGELAAEIIRRAREAGVYVHESRELVSVLMQVELDQHIPPALYLAVAELLAWVHRVERGKGTAREMQAGFVATPREAGAGAGAGALALPSAAGSLPSITPQRPINH